MNQPEKQFGRSTNNEKLRMYIRDKENTVMYTPEDYSGNRFLGTWNKAMSLQTMLFHEQREKYTDKYTAMLKAESEMQSVPICFDACVKDVVNGLNSDEKNCMRDCYLKRVSMRDDFNVLMQQRLVIENAKAMRERLV